MTDSQACVTQKAPSLLASDLICKIVLFLVEGGQADWAHRAELQALRSELVLLLLLLLPLCQTMAR